MLQLFQQSTVTLFVKRSFVLVFWLVPVILSLAGLGCRKEAEGTIDPAYTYPYLYSVQLKADTLNLDTSPVTFVEPNGDGTYTISDSLWAQVLDPVDGNNIRSCSYQLTPPGVSYPVQTGSLTRVLISSNTATFSGRIQFNVPRAAVGKYYIRVTAQGSSEYLSNTVVPTLFITRRNARPMLSNLLIPDTLHRPSTGTQIVRFAVTAYDSDGLADIQKVFFKSVNSTSPTFEQPMFDDGNLSLDGDTTALDGRYSRLLPLDSTATLGRLEFRFWARDNAGALSDSLVRFIVITFP